MSGGKGWRGGGGGGGGVLGLICKGSDLEGVTPEFNLKIFHLPPQKLSASALQFGAGRWLVSPELPRVPLGQN